MQVRKIFSCGVCLAVFFIFGHGFLFAGSMGLRSGPVRGLSGAGPGLFQKFQESAEKEYFLEQEVLAQIKAMAPEISAIDQELLVSAQIQWRFLGEESERVFAVNQGGVIFFNKATLSAMVRDLEKIKIPFRQIPKILAAQYLPTIAHELRHSYNDRYLRGAPNCLEEEMSAYSVEIGALRQARQVYPKHFEVDSLITEAQMNLWRMWYRDGPLGLRRGVRINTGQPSVLDQQFAETLPAKAQYVSTWIDSIDEMAFYRRASIEESSEDFDEWLSEATNGWIPGQAALNDETYRKQLREFVDFAIDPANIMAAQEYYRKDQCRIWQQWQEDFPDKAVNSDPPSYCFNLESSVGR